MARSNIHLLTKMGVRVRCVAPSTLLPSGIANFGVEVFRDMDKGLADADVVMMLRLQVERMSGAFVPSLREYYQFYGLTEQKLARAKPGALVMHPGPMNRGVEIDSSVADGAQSVIREQVEMGVAVRMAILDGLDRRAAREQQHDGSANRSRRPTSTPMSWPPAQGLDGTGGILFEDGWILVGWQGVTRDSVGASATVVDCKGRVLTPGLIDMRVFTGEPGSEYRETLASASEAAAAGGVTTMIVMPDTQPVIDDAAIVDYVLRRARDTALGARCPHGGDQQRSGWRTHGGNRLAEARRCRGRDRCRKAVEQCQPLPPRPHVCPRL